MKRLRNRRVEEYATIVSRGLLVTMAMNLPAAVEGKKPLSGLHGLFILPSQRFSWVFLYTETGFFESI